MNLSMPGHPVYHQLTMKISEKKKKKLSRGEKNQPITAYTIITQMIDLIGKKIITVIITVIIIYSLSSSNELSEHVC